MGTTTLPPPWWSQAALAQACLRPARLLRRCAECARLIVHDERTLPRRNGGWVREIPLDAITGTFEAGRALDFDNEFRPSKRARKRWLRVWVGEHTGAGLPPIDVVQVGDGLRGARRPPPRVGRPRPRRGHDRRRRRLRLGRAREQHVGDLAGVVLGRHVPAAARTNSRAVGGTSRGRATSRSCSGQASVSGTSISRQPGEASGAHAGVGGVEPGRVRVGAHEPQRGVVRAPAPDARSCPPSAARRPPLARAAAAAAPGRSARASRARARALRPQRLRPQAGGRDRGDRPRVARERQLERHPAAERVARDVRTLESARGDRRGEPAAA